MSPFSILLLLVLGVILYSLWPLIRQIARISAVHRQVKREYRRREEAQEQAARDERAQKSSADILREAQHDLGGGSYVEYEEVDDDTSGNS